MLPGGGSNKKWALRRGKHRKLIEITAYQKLQKEGTRGLVEQGTCSGAKRVILREGLAKTHAPKATPKLDSRGGVTWNVSTIQKIV